MRAATNGHARQVMVAQRPPTTPKKKKKKPQKKKKPKPQKKKKQWGSLVMGTSSPEDDPRNARAVAF